MRKLLIGLSAITFASTNLPAGLTPIGRYGAGEASQQQIASHLYGKDFIRAGDDFVSSSITLRRIDDLNDSRFDGAKYTAKAVAKFSSFSQSIGIGGGGGTAHLFDVGGYGYDVSGSQVSGSQLGTNTFFTRSGESGNHSSRAADNADGRDHLITYQVLGLKTTDNVWLMFWEDMDVHPNTPAKRSFSDFNDLAIELRAAAIPLPAAVWTGGLALGIAIAMRRFLRRVLGI